MAKLLKKVKSDPVDRNTTRLFCAEAVQLDFAEEDPGQSISFRSPSSSSQDFWYYEQGS